jgi:hypothetical protein
MMMNMTRKVDIRRISDNLILLKAKPKNDINSRNNKTLVSKESPQRKEKLRNMISLVVPERSWMKLFFGM